MGTLSVVSGLKTGHTLVVVGSDETFQGNFPKIVSHFVTSTIFLYGKHTSAKSCAVALLCLHGYEALFTTDSTAQPALLQISILAL